MDHSPPKDTPVLPVIPLCPRPLKTQPDVTQALAACVDLAPHLRPCFGLPKTLLFRPVSCTDTAPVLPPLSPGNPQALVVASAAAEQAAVHGDGAGLLLLLTASLLTQARDLLALGVEGAEIRAGYRLGCGRALALLEQQGVCGRLGEPRDELQVGATLGPFLSAWQPGFDVALGVAAARCCVYGWTPVTSGDTLRVCTVLDDSRDEAVGKEEEEEEEDRAGRDDYTEFGGEEHPDVEDEIDKMGEEVSQETQTAETDREPTTEPRGEEEKPATDRATHSNKKNKYDKDSTGQGEEDTPSQLEKKKTTHASSALPGLRLPLQASAVVEEPKDGSARPGVRLTLRSPDASLLVSAQGAVQACLRVYRSLLAEPRLVAGAGVAELALAVGLTQQGLGLVGMEQLVVHAFAQALLQPARVLGENSGDPGDLAVLRLYRSHREKEKEGVWSRETSAPTVHHQGTGQAVLDPLGCKASAIQKATEATLNVLAGLIPGPTWDGVERGDEHSINPTQVV
uniref:T-complex protein 1 subunit theta-like 2 n=1 Tax=Gadus morhua TaxID=8049 RepID=A0A8C4ZU01_GADMO